MDASVPATFVINFSATWALIGLAWHIQIVHYPLLAQIGAARFTRYHRQHVARITWVVAPLMLAELTTGILLAVYPPPQGAWLMGTALGLIIVTWFSTFAIQLPLHARLERGFDPFAHRWLVTTNWLRTICWSARGVLLLWIAL